MRRYQHLGKADVYSALNRLRNAFLAAKSGEDVNEIINGLLSSDEKLKIGRRILVAECLKKDLTVDEISLKLKVGRSTVVSVAKLLSTHPICYQLLEKRDLKVESEYLKKRYKNIGGSKLIYKQKQYTGIKRVNITR